MRSIGNVDIERTETEDQIRKGAFGLLFCSLASGGGLFEMAKW